MPAEQADRERTVKGWVYAAVGVDLLRDAVDAATSGQFELEVFDGAEATAENMIFDSQANRPRDALGGSKAEPFASSSFAGVAERTVFGRTWLFRFRAHESFEERGYRSHAWVLLVGGLGMSVLGAGLTWSLVSGRARALRLADEIMGVLRGAEAERHRLALVASRTASAVFICDAEWRIEWANESFERFYGHGIAECKGRLPGELLSGPDTNLATVEKFKTVCARGGAFKGELLNYTNQGEPRWVEVDFSGQGGLVLLSLPNVVFCQCGFGRVWILACPGCPGP